MNISQKFKSIVGIRNNIISLIDLNQDIRKLLIYNSLDPLSEQAIDLEGNIVFQSELEESLINKNIFPTPFVDSILTESKNILFCHLYSGDLRDNVKGNNTLVIDICVDSKYNNLNNIQDRSFEIAQEIATMVDKENNIGSLGNCKLTNYKESIISNNKNYSILSLFIEIPTSNTKY